MPPFGFCGDACKVGDHGFAQAAEQTAAEGHKQPAVLVSQFWRLAICSRCRRLGLLRLLPFCVINGGVRSPLWGSRRLTPAQPQKCTGRGIGRQRLYYTRRS